MERIFSSLAVVALLMLATNLYLGLQGGDVNAVATRLRTEQLKMRELRSSLMTRSDAIQAQQQAVDAADAAMTELQPAKSRHVLVGLMTAVVTLIVNCICVTYFIGTGRWCSEVTATYQLDASRDEEARRLKKTTFPWSLLAMMTVLGIAALGAAADPGTLRATTARYVAPHFLAAIIGTLIIAWAFWRQHQGIVRNGRLIDQIMAEVKKMREARGLEVPNDASRPLDLPETPQ